MWIVTCSVSLANPVKEGVVLLDGDLTELNATVGAAVLTVKLTVLLLPVGFPSELAWVAIAEYCPLERAGLAPPELQSPPVPPAVALDTSVDPE